jgi:hypothetical protein
MSKLTGVHEVLRLMDEASAYLRKHIGPPAISPRPASDERGMQFHVKYLHGIDRQASFAYGQDLSIGKIVWMRNGPHQPWGLVKVLPPVEGMDKDTIHISPFTDEETNKLVPPKGWDKVDTSNEYQELEKRLKPGSRWRAVINTASLTPGTMLIFERELEYSPSRKWRFKLEGVDARYSYTLEEIKHNFVPVEDQQDEHMKLLVPGSKWRAISDAKDYKAGDILVFLKQSPGASIYSLRFTAAKNGVAFDHHLDEVKTNLVLVKDDVPAPVGKAFSVDYPPMRRALQPIVGREYEVRTKIANAYNTVRLDQIEILPKVRLKYVGTSKTFGDNRHIFEIVSSGTMSGDLVGLTRIDLEHKLNEVMDPETTAALTKDMEQAEAKINEPKFSGPYWADPCSHTREEYAGTFEIDGEFDENKGIYDVYVFSDAHRTPANLKVCMRYGYQSHEMESGGDARQFAVDSHGINFYAKAAPLVKAWLEAHDKKKAAKPAPETNQQRSPMPYALRIDASRRPLGQFYYCSQKCRTKNTKGTIGYSFGEDANWAPDSVCTRCSQPLDTATPALSSTAQPDPSNTLRQDQAISKLKEVALNAIDYVGSANYADRQRAARRAVEKAATAAKEGRLADIEFNL